MHPATRHHLRRHGVAAVLTLVVVALVVAGCGWGGGDAASGGTSLPANDPAGYVPLPGAGAPNTTPVDPRLSSFCHQYYVFVLETQAIVNYLGAGDLDSAKRSLGAANAALQRVTGVAPGAIAQPVTSLAAYVADDADTLRAQASVAAFTRSVGPLVGRIYKPYVDSYTWFVANCPTVLFAPGHQSASTSTTSAPAASSGGPTAPR
jgi:hypothetical protein